MKPKGVTTQMKALNEYFPMVGFTLLLNSSCLFSPVSPQNNGAHGKVIPQLGVSYPIENKLG